MIEYFDRCRFDQRQALANLRWGYAFAFESLAIDRQVGLAGEVNLIDGSARAEDFEQHLVDRRQALARRLG